MHARVIGAVLGLSALVLAAPSARADSIDGAWCHDNGARLMISGPTIVTPGGTRMQGDYQRHAFSYVAPAGDAGAGGTIQMRLLNEETVQILAGPQGPDAIWRRCGPPVS